MMEIELIVAGGVFSVVVVGFIYTVKNFKDVIIKNKVTPKAVAPIGSGNVAHIVIPENNKLRIVVQTFLEAEDALTRGSYEEYICIKARALKMSKGLTIKLKNTG